MGRYLQQDQVHDVTLVHVCTAEHTLRQSRRWQNWLAMPIAASSRATDQALLRWRQLLRAQAGGADVQQAWGRPGALLPHCGLRKPAPLWCLLLSASWLNPQLDATTVCQLLKRQCDGPMEQVRGRSTEASEGLVRGSSANVSYACSPFL
jgi:hypothetical protein